MSSLASRKRKALFQDNPQHQEKRSALKCSEFILVWVAHCLVCVVQGLFGVFPENGSVYVASELDRETVEEITLTLFVQDLNAEKPPLQNNTGRHQNIH